MKRRKARESILQILFMLDDGAFALDKINSIIELYLSQLISSTTMEVLDRPYLEKILFGISQELSTLDSLIEKHSDNWKINRMTKVDRNILRLAAYELLFLDKEIPSAVSMDEAIELAKRYGSEDSQSFINGILDSLYKKQTK